MVINFRTFGSSLASRVPKGVSEGFFPMEWNRPGKNFPPDREAVFFHEKSLSTALFQFLPVSFICGVYKSEDLGDGPVEIRRDLFIDIEPAQD